MFVNTNAGGQEITIYWPLSIYYIRQDGTTSAQPKSDVTKNSTTSKSHNHYTANDKHVVKRIVGHSGKVESFYYVVRLYGYSPKDDSVRPENHTSPHFTMHYWRCIDKKTN